MKDSTLAVVFMVLCIAIGGFSALAYHKGYRQCNIDKLKEFNAEYGKINKEWTELIQGWGKLNKRLEEEIDAIKAEAPQAWDSADVI